MTEMINLIKEIYKTVVTDESMKKEIEKTLNLIEHQIPKEVIVQPLIIIYGNDIEQDKNKE